MPSVLDEIACVSARIWTRNTLAGALWHHLPILQLHCAGGCWPLLRLSLCCPHSHPSNECLAGMVCCSSSAVLSSPQNGVNSSYLSLSKNNEHRRHKYGDIIISFSFIFTLRLKMALHRKITMMYLSNNVVIPVCSFMQQKTWGKYSNAVQGKKPFIWLFRGAAFFEGVLFHWLFSHPHTFSIKGMVEQKETPLL